MATETPVPDHATAEQHVEEKENEELKTIETEIVSLPKVEELAAPKAPVVESEEKAEGKKIDPPAVIEAEKYMDAEKVNDGPGWDVPPQDSDAATKVVESVGKPTDSLLTPEPAPEVETTPEEVSEESKVVVKPESIVHKQEAEKLAAPEAPIIESEEKIEDKKIDQPVVVEADKYMDAEKVDEGPGWDVPSENSDAATNSTNSNVFLVSEPTIKDVEKETVTQTEIAAVPEAVVESVEKPIDLPPTPEPAPEVETKPKEVSEESKEVVKPESVVEEQDLGKAAEVPPEIKEVETTASTAEETEIEKPLEISASESKVEDSPESVVEVEKPGEQSENNEEIVKVSDVKLEQKEITERELPKEEGVTINEAEEVIESLPEKEAGENQAFVACKSSETAASEPPSGPVDVGVSVTPDVSDKAQEVESEVDALEASAKAASLEVIKAEEENMKGNEITEPETTINEKVDDAEQSTDVTEKPLEEPKVSAEVKIEKSDGTDSNSAPGTAETSIQGQDISKDVEVVPSVQKEIDAENGIAPVEINKDTETQFTKTEGEGDSSCAAGVVEKSLEGEASKDLGVVTEEKKEEDVKDFTSASVETSNDTDLEGKVGDVKTVDTTNETVSKPKELDLEAKATTLADTVVDESAKAADAVEETPKSDAMNLESSKGIDEPKTNEDVPKEEVPKKQSHGIMSKVKQSIVKVKKAITGKSPNSKTISSDAKDDIKVK